MSEHGIGETTAIRLAELSREIDELEKGRAALLRRVIDLRDQLQESGHRTGAMRASVDLLCEHISNVTTVMAELQVIEEELRTVSGALEDDGKSVAGVVFEADGLQDALDEAENELERISTILINGKSRSPRGH
jgi:chromosome segregation ATPase